MWRVRIPSLNRLQIRVMVYILVIAGLFLLRGRGDWSERLGRALLPSPPDTTLRIAGLDLAPELIPRLAAHYREEYPAVAPRLLRGGTQHALESLLEGDADLGFLTRSPSTAEQRLCREVRGDTLLWFPVAVGGIVLLGSAEAPAETLDAGELRAELGIPTGPDSPRIYAPDPNLGIWPAFLEAIGADSAAVHAEVIFLADAEAVVRAVEADPGARGVATTLCLPPDAPQSSVVLARLRSPRTGEPVPPDLEDIISGEYPLFHRLFIALPEKGSREAGKFATFVVSAHGQRVVEQAGCVPARYVLREIQLSTPQAGESR